LGRRDEFMSDDHPPTEHASAAGSDTPTCLHAEASVDEAAGLLCPPCGALAADAATGANTTSGGFVFDELSGAESLRSEEDDSDTRPQKHLKKSPVTDKPGYDFGTCEWGFDGRGASSVGLVSPGLRARIQDELAKIKAKDEHLAYWGRRCLDCNYSHGLHVNFDCYSKKIMVADFVKQHAWPVGIAEGTLPPWLNKCDACAKVLEAEANCASSTHPPRCVDCARPPCQLCQTKPNSNVWRADKKPDGTYLCRPCKYPACQACQKKPHCGISPSEREGDGTYVCRQCKHPPYDWHPFCKGCAKQASHRVTASRRETDGTYVCDRCRYPPCSRCHVTERPRRSDLSPDWCCPSCRDCQPGKSCVECLGEKPVDNFTPYKSGCWHDRCIDCEFPTCSKCGQAAITLVLQREKEPDHTFTCHTCQYPPCSGCGRRKRPQRSEYEKSALPYRFCGYISCQVKKKAHQT
jgi:hypothetical protein